MEQLFTRRRPNTLPRGNVPMIGMHRENAKLPEIASNLVRARANALPSGNAERPSRQDLEGNVRNRVVAPKDRLDRASDWIDEKAGKADNWIEGKISAADKFIQDNTFGGKSKVFNGLLSVYDKYRNLKDDFHDWKDDMSEKYHNSKFGKAMDKAGSWVKGKASAAGKWIKDKFKSDGGPGLIDKIKAKYEGSKLQKGVNWVKGKASAAGNWIKDKFKGDGSPGLMDKIKAKYKGSFLEKGVNAVKDAAVSAKDWVKDKAVSAKDWIKDKAIASKDWIKDNAVSAKNWVKDKYNGSSLQKGVNMAKSKAVAAAGWLKDKKERAQDYIADFKGKLADHDDERYEKHREEKYGDEYRRQKAEYEASLKQGEIGQNVAEMNDLDSLLGPEDQEESSIGMTGNRHDLVGKASGYGAKAGGFIAKQGVKKFLSKTMDKDIAGLYGTGASSSISAINSGIKFGIKTKEIHDLNKLNGDQVTAGAADDRQALKLSRARDAMVANLNRGRVGDAADTIGSLAKAAGSFVDAANGVPKNGLGSLAGKAISGLASAGGKLIQGKMRDKDDKKIVKNAIFGSKDAYKAEKAKYNLLRAKDMKIGMTRATNTRNMSELADRSRFDMANNLMATRGEGNGGYNMLKQRGYTDEAIQKLSAEDVAKELGSQRSARQLRRKKKFA